MQKLRFAFIFIASISFYAGCLEDIAEVPLDVPDASLGVPRVLISESASGYIKLVWHGVDGAASYRVYRSSSLSESFERAAETQDTSYVDSTVRSGVTYSYKVAAVGRSGLEGKQSESVSAKASIYGIMINGGAKYSSSKTLVLNITAPETTRHMMISSNQDLYGSVWESFATQKIFNIDAADGSVSVYARFLDENGSLSPIVSDEIVLDTYARIVSVELEPDSRVYSPSATVKIKMRVEGSETGGRGDVSFGGLASVQLADDGRAGDETADDGIYSREYCFPSSVRGLRIPLEARFTDRAGNEAPLFEAGKISFTDPPNPVQLLAAVDSSRTSITIKWTASTEEHFAAYRIYRSTSAGVAEIPANFVRELANQAQTSYPDGQLTEGVRYYYRIFVVNDLAETAASNEIAASTFDGYPTPPILDDPSSIGPTRLTLTWSENPDTDFREYRIYRATSPGVTTSSQLVATISNRETTFFDDEGLDTAANTYYYRVYVVDRAGKSSRSNEVASR